MTKQETLGQEYNSTFFTGIADGSRASAKVVLPIIIKLAGPTSVLDVGCGSGAWLAEWASQGVTDVLGVDGEYVNKAELQIDAAKFVPTDLQQPFTVGRKFDLVQCLEVAEHLEAGYADRLVDSLTSHGDVILFSAAMPGQGGTHHVNEQWPSYWIEKFAQHGFTVYDVIRPLIWMDPRVEMWYRQNILLFAKYRAFEAPPEDTRFDIVHPDFWKTRMDSSQGHSYDLVRLARRASRHVIKGKLRQILKEKLRLSRQRSGALN